MIHGQSLQMLIKQAVRAGLAKVPHDASAWKHGVPDLLSQNISLSGFQSPYSRSGQMEAVPYKNKTKQEKKKTLVPLLCPPESPYYLYFPTIQVFPAHWRLQRMEICQHLKKSVPQEHRNSCWVGCGETNVLPHCLCILGICRKEVCDFKSITTRVPVG